MSRRLREKRNAAANLLRVIASNPDHLAQLGCSYGCHSWTFDFDRSTKTCTICEAVYGMPAAEAEEMRLLFAPTATTTCPICLGEQFVIVEQRGVDVEVGCPCTHCPCGAVAVAPGLLCEEHEDAAEIEYDRRAERRADV